VSYPPSPPPAAARRYDPGKPHVARMYNYFLGGKDNRAVDRDAAGLVLAQVPEARDIAKANRAFMARAVRYLAAGPGITQFLDIGTGIPAAPNVHEIAQGITPGSRVVYADNDPIVLAHARALLPSTPEGATAYIDADLRDPAEIIREAGETLDFREPVALLLVAVLHFIPDADDPGGITAALLEALAPGSYLVLSHGTADFHEPAVTHTAASAYDGATGPLVLRPRAEVGEFFGGLTLEPPGLVQAPLWRPGREGDGPENLAKIGIYAGVAAKR
jgi:S-adenosyl methyltransferase